MSRNFETLAVHAGYEPEPATGAVMPPIYQVSTFAQQSPGQGTGYEYARTDNPTRTPLQKALAELEEAKYALAFASGLAATDAVLNTLRSGDHVIAGNDLYGGTLRLFTKVAQERGIAFDFVDLNSSALDSAFRENTRLVWFETPTNPLLSIIDIARVSATAHDRGAKVAVDNTFMSPFFQNPLQHGADIVMHSMTKYINGHSDVVMGALMTSDDDLYQRLKFLQNAIGGVPGPWDCYLALRGIRTLALRMKAHGDNAMAVAQWLAQDSRIEEVLYPGLTNHPGHEIASRQARGFGGMLSFRVKGGLDQARKVLERVRLFTLAESLGGVESLIEHPGIMTHASIPKEQREAIGITDSLIRASIGIEHHEDLIADLDQALG
jgi:cystathionine gamma-lyase